MTTITQQRQGAEQQASDFSERLLDVLNGAALSMMLSVGHRTGLFDVMESGGPWTSAELAEAAKLDERYVREWLGAMVTGRIVAYDPGSGRYELPAAHRAFLCRSSAENMASTMQWISVLGGTEDRLVECFRAGGGVPYEAFARFHEVMAEESAVTVVAALEGAILPLVPDVRRKLELGIEALDVGCGSGFALCHLAEVFPESRFTGYDLSPEGVGRARAMAVRRGLANVRFEVLDAAQIEDVARFDFVTAFDAIHDQAAPGEVLRRIRRALKPDGTFLMQDIKASSRVEENVGAPLGPFLYTISTMHCMTVSLACRGEGLGTCWGRQKAQAMLSEAGFGRTVRHELDHDILNDYYVCRPA